MHSSFSALQYAVEDVIPRIRTFRSELRMLDDDDQIDWAGIQLKSPTDGPALSPSSSFQSRVVLATGASPTTPTEVRSTRITQISRSGSQHSLEQDARVTTPTVPMETFQTITVSSIPGRKPPSPVKVQPNITSISIVSKGQEVDSRAEHIPPQSVQSVITVSSSSTVPRGQVVYVSAVLNPKTGRKMSLEQAIESGLLDMKTGLFFDPRTGRRMSLSEAARLGFMDKDLVKQLQQKCGLRDPSTGRELSILEAMQRGHYDPLSGQVTDLHSGQRMSLEEAAARGMISHDALQTLSYISIRTSSTSQSQAYYGMSSMDGAQVSLSLADALDKGLYIPDNGRFLEPVSREPITLAEAMGRGIIDSQVRDIVHPVTGEKLTLDEAISQGIINPHTGRFTDPRSGRQMSLDEAHQKGLIQRPMSLHTVLTEGIMDAGGQIKDQNTGKKMTLREALDRGILDLDFKCILDPRTNELLSLQEAMDRGLVSPSGHFIDPRSGRRLSLHDAINEGLAQIFSQDVCFPQRGIRDTITGESLTLAEAISRGFFDPSSAMYLDKKTGRRMSLEEAVRIGLIEPKLSEELSKDSGLTDIVGSRLSVMEALKRGLLDPVTGHIKDSSTGRSMTMEEAVSTGCLKPDDAQQLMKLTSAVMATKTIMTKIKPSEARDKPLRAISVAEAVQQGLVNEEQGLFKDPSTGTVMKLTDAIQQGYLLSTTSEWDSETLSTVSSYPSDKRGAVVPMMHGDLASLPPEDHVSMQESDQYVRDIVGGKEEVQWSERKDFHTRKTREGIEAISTQEAKMSQVQSTAHTEFSGDVSFPIPIKTAIAMKLLDTETGVFRDPTNGQQMPLEQAVERELLNIENTLFVHPMSKREFTLKDALEKLLLDATGHYSDPRTKAARTMEDLIQNGIIIFKEKPKPTPHIAETKKMIIKSVLDPRTGEWLDPERASRRHLLDKEMGSYTHPASAEALTINEAIDAGYIQAEPDTSSDWSGGIKETRSFNITGAVDPDTGSMLDVATALKKGVIDQANGKYICKDRYGREEKIPISEAIKRGLVIATSTDAKPTQIGKGTKYIQETQTCTIHSVVDPRTKQQITVSEAIQKGILNQSEGQYVNPVTGDKMLVTDAIQRGLVMAAVTSVQEPTDKMAEARILASRSTTYKLKSVIHPLTKMELSVNEAVDLGIINKTKGEYYNKLTGEVLSISDAIDKGLVKVEVGVEEENEDEEPERVPSIHIDDDLDALDEMALEEVTEVTKKFQITGVKDLATGETITLDKAHEQGIVNEARGVYYNYETHQTIPISEALNKGLIVGELVAATEQEHFRSDLVASEKEGRYGEVISVINPISGLAISATQAMQLGLLSPDKKTYYDPSTDKRMTVEEAKEKGLVNPSQKDRDRASGPEHSTFDIMQEQEEFGPSRPRFITDWANGCVRNGRTGEKMPLYEAVREGYIDQLTADLLSRKAETMPFRGLTRPHDPHEILLRQEMHHTETMNIDGVKTVTAEQSTANGNDDTVTLTIQSTKLVEPDVKSIVVEEPMDTAPTEPQVSHAISFESAVKLGLFDIRTGRFTDPATGQQMTIQEAINRGCLDPKATAISDITTGRTISLQDALVKNLISNFSGLVNESKINELNITLDPQLVRDRARMSPVNFEDAILSGMLDLDTGLVLHPHTKQHLTLQQAINARVINPETTVIVNPNSGLKLTLQQAIDEQIVDGDTGDFIDTQSKKKLLSLKDAVNSGLVESTVSADSEYVMDWQRGVKIPLPQAIREGKIDPKAPTVYDPVQKKRVSVEEAKQRGILDQNTGDYKDPTTGRRINAKDAAKLGLLAVVGAPVLAGLAAAEGVRRLTQTLREKQEKMDMKANLKERVLIPHGQEKQPLPIQGSLADRPSLLGRSYGSKEAHGMKEVDMVSEVQPVQVEISDGHFKASQKITTASHTKQVKEVIKDGERSTTETIQAPVRPAIHPSPATTVYHRGDQDAADTRVTMTKTHITKQPDYMPYDVDITVQPKPGQTIVKPLPVEITLQKPRDSASAVTEVKTSTLTEVKKSRTISEGERKYTVTDSQRYGDYPRQEELVQDWEKGQVYDRRSGYQVSVQEAIDRGLIQINWDRGVIIDTATQERMSVESALQQGLIDSHIATLIETRMHQVRETVPDRITLNEAVTRGLLIIPLGQLRHPRSDRKMTIKEAINMGFLDPDSSVIIDPATGKQLTLTEAIQRGLLDPNTGDMKNTATRKVMSFSELCLEGLVPEHGIRRRGTMSVQEAIQSGYIDVKTGTFTNPQTGETMDIIRAVQLGLIESRETDETEDIMTTHIKTTAVKEPTPTRPVSFNDAVHEGLIDAKTGTFTDPFTGKVMTLLDAIRLGFIVAPDVDEHPQEGVDGLRFEDALNQGLIEVKSNTFTEPITGVLMPLDAAIRKGYVVLPAQGISVITVDETTVEKKSTKSHPMSFSEAVEKGFIDIERGTYLDPRTGTHLPLPEAIRREMIDPTAELTDGGATGMSLTEAIDKGYFNETTGIFTDPNTGKKRSLTEAMMSGLIDKESIIYDAENFRMMTVEQAIQDRRLDPHTGQFIQQSTARRMSIKQAAKLGLLGLIGAPVMAGMAVKEAIRRGRRSRSHSRERMLTSEDTSAEVPDRDILEFTRVQETTSRIDQKKGLSVIRAIRQGLLDTESGTMVDPKTDQKLTLKQAVERGTLDPESVEVIDPQTAESMDLQSAINQGVLGPTGRYVDPASNKMKSLREALREGIVSAGQNADEPVLKKVITREKIKLAVDSVVHPVSHKKVRLDRAVAEGVINRDKGIYLNRQTGDSLSVGQAYEDGLIKGQIIDTVRTKEEVITGGSKARNELQNITTVIDPMSRKQISREEAIHRGILDPDSGAFTNPQTGETISIYSAIEKGFVITKETVTTLKKTYRIQTDDQPQSVTIRTVVDPRTGRELTLLEAISEGLISEGSGQYHHPQTGRVLQLDEAISMGLVRVDSHLEVLDSSIHKHTETRHQRQTFNIKAVIDPRTDEKLHPNEAVSRGVLDLKLGVYTNPQTGESMPIHEAYDQGFIIADEMEGSQAGPVLSATAIVETKSYTVVAAYDTRTNEKVPIEEAIKRGLIDKEMAKYIDMKNSRTMTIQDAIECGLVIAHEGATLPSSASIQKETTSFAIKSIIDPRTGEEIPIADAVRHKIVDREKNEFVNLETDEVMPLSLAIHKGLVITESLDQVGRKSALIEAGIMPLTTVYSLKTVKDPNTGVEYDPVEAERRGLINKTRGMYIDPITARSISIKAAIGQGFITAEEVEEPDYDDLPQDATTYATIEATREAEVMHISSVMDRRTGEEIALMEAVRRGIMDPNSGTYKDKVTGSSMTLQEAIEKGYIKARSKTQDTLLRSQTPKLTKSVHVTGVVDPGSGRDMSVSEAIRAGMLDTEKGEFINVVSGQKMALDKAIEKGHVRTDGAETQHMQSQQVSSMSYKTESQSFFREAGLSQPHHREDTGTQPPPPDLGSGTSTVRDGEAPESTISSDIDSGGTIPDKGGGLLYTEAKDQGLIDVEKNIYFDHETGKEMPLDDALDNGKLIADIPVKIKDKETVKTSVKTEVTTTHLDKEGKIVGVEKYESVAEPPTSEDTDSRDGYPASSTDETLDSETTFQDALTRGLIDMQTCEYINPITGDRFPLQEAADAGLVSLTDPDEKMSLEEAIARGIVNPATGKMTDPKTGQAITVDEGVLLGYLTVRDRSATPEEDESARGVSFAEALERGLYNPVTGKFSDPQTGRVCSLDDAIKRGLVKTKLPCAGGNEPETPVSPKRTAPPTPPPRPKRQKSKDDSLLLNGKTEETPQKDVLKQDAPETATNGHVSPMETTNGHVHVEDVTKLKDTPPSKIDDSAISETSSEGPSSYIIEPGFQIAGPDQVVNVRTGEMMSLAEAVSRHVATPIDEESHDDQMSGVSTAVSSIFERVSGVLTVLLILVVINYMKITLSLPDLALCRYYLDVPN